MESQYLHVSDLPVGTHMSGYDPQLQQCIVQQTSTSTPATSVQQGSTSTPSVALPGPLAYPICHPAPLQVILCLTHIVPPSKPLLQCSTTLTAS